MPKWIFDKRVQLFTNGFFIVWGCITVYNNPDPATNLINGMLIGMNIIAGMSNLHILSYDRHLTKISREHMAAIDAEILEKLNILHQERLKLLQQQEEFRAELNAVAKKSAEEIVADLKRMEDPK